ncbi:MAG: hypothetical protein ACRBDL_06540 [Alphaproteobacteria bacterium]
MLGRIKKSVFGGKARGLVLVFALVFMLSGSFITMCGQKKAEAFCTPCISCLILDPAATVFLLNIMEDSFWEPLIRDNITDHMNSEINWIVDDFFDDYVFYALAELTEYLGAFGMLQVQIVGDFFDAKHYLETQRLYFKLHAEAHKDYHPSDDFCWFGTNARSLASTDNRARLATIALSNMDLQRQLGFIGSSSALSKGDDKKNRWNRFVNTYCDPKDNNWINAGTGLDLACDRDGLGLGAGVGATDRARVNRDIDYTALIDEPRTLEEVNFLDQSGAGNANVLTNAEEDVMAMSANLYGDGTPTRRLSRELFAAEATSETATALYMDLRSVVAKRAVAQNSFNALVAMKSEGTNGDSAAPLQPNTGRFVGAIIRDLMPAGMTDAQIFGIMGENPSYYAQLEVLGKKIYQNPDFFANLYDKPANVARKSVAMKAISLMLDRALFESELRQEMLLSVMLSSELSKRHKVIDRDLDVGGKRFQDATILNPR